MPGARPSSFKRAGGFLNHVDAVIASYEFTNGFPGAEKKAPRKGVEEFNSLFCKMTFKVDGSDDEQSTTLFAGSADDFEIENDGLTLIPADTQGLRGGTPFAHFIETLIDKGYPDTNLPEEEINYEPIIGTRVRLVQEKDEAAMNRAAKTYRTSGGKFNEAGQKKSQKDGKYYNLTRLAVEDVIALPGANGKSAVKTAPMAKTNGNGNGKAVKTDELYALTSATLLEILADADGSIMKAKLPGKITLKMGSKHPQREEVRRLMYSDDFLGKEDGWAYDASGKDQKISLQ